jgi:hypothetical protein
MPGSATTPGWAGTRAGAPVHFAFRDYEHVGTRDFQAFAAQWLAYVLPYRCFADTLAGANARLGADADRYSFTVVDLHLLLFAGFDRRTEILDFCPFLGRRRGRTRESNEHNRGQADRSEDKFRPTPGIIDPSGHDAYVEGWRHTDEQIKNDK